MNYESTLSAVQEVIERQHPEIQPQAVDPLPVGVPAPPEHLLWMAGEIKLMDDKEKAGRWLGWLLAHMEFGGYWDNSHSRDLVRIDVGTKPKALWRE